MRAGEKERTGSARETDSGLNRSIHCTWTGKDLHSLI